MKKYYIAITAIFILAISAGVAYQLMTTGARGDQAKVDDLTEIQRGIENYVGQAHVLPPNLEAVSLAPALKARSSSYTYEKTGADSYKLCAHFEKSTLTKDSDAYDGAVSSQHGKGLYCYQIQEYGIEPAPEPEGASGTPPAPSSQDITFCTTTAGANMAYDGAIESVNVQSKEIAVVDQGATNFFRWSTTEPKVFDANCKAIPVSQLRAGEKVTLYYIEKPGQTHVVVGVVRMR